LEFGKIVTALSSKPVILAVPAQARQAARVSRAGCQSGWARSGKVVGNLQSTETGAAIAAGNAKRRVPPFNHYRYGVSPTVLFFCLSEKAT
jgi:hypothetical protein